MWFVVAGALLVILKLLGLGPVAAWPWWWVLIPFGLAAAWWAWADASGYTQRKAMQRMDARKAARRARAVASMRQGGSNGNSKFPPDTR